MCVVGSEAKQSFAAVRSQTEFGTEEVLLYWPLATAHYPLFSGIG